MSDLCAPACEAFGTTPQAAASLNTTCACWPIDTDAIRDSLSPVVRSALGDTQKHLFANTGVFLHVEELQAMQAQVKAIESVAQLPSFVSLSGAEAQQVSTRGALMGYDFHLTAQGPKLIEINTNAGGVFLVEALRSVVEPAALTEMFFNEWKLAGRVGVPQTIAIVDDNPAEQYLYADMLAAAELLRQSVARVVILSAAELTWSGTALSAEVLGGIPIDMVYNRHTDFSLVGDDVRHLRAAWVADRVVLTPSPRHHALYASKTNLATLTDAEQLQRLGVTLEDQQALAAIPATTVVTANNAVALWNDRRNLFFKPAAGFGGRAAYRGAKLTKRVWRTILENSVSAQEGKKVLTGYVAQRYVPPSYRCLPQTSAEPRRLKLDIRLYTYAGATLAVAARIYDGQTTNFRTSGGGFAPVAVLGG